jgi:hypothetical protein
MKTLRVSVISACLGLVGMMAVACSSSDEVAQSTEVVGEVGMAITLPTNAGSIDSVAWAITGNGVSRSDSVAVGASQNASAQIGGIPAGNGYILTLNASTPDRAVTCSGTATFNIVAGQTSRVSLELSCTDSSVNQPPATNGQLAFSATPVELPPPCAIIESISASPTEVVEGGSVALSATSWVLDPQSSALIYTWSAANGFAATGASATFPCTVAGTYAIILTISDGRPGCDASNSETQIVCSPRGDTQHPIVTARGPDCYACAMLACNDYVDGANSCETMTGTAPTGGGAGRANSSLCWDTLTCPLTNNCAADGSIQPCFCGTASGTNCLSDPNGACLAVELSGFYGDIGLDGYADAVRRWSDPSYPSGRANRAVQCLLENCRTSCF